MPQTKKRITTEYVEVREAATGKAPDGGPFVLSPGEVFASDHPYVHAYPDFFTPLQRERPTVEQATAAPGEKRG